MIANRFYLVSSLCFLAGAIMTMWNAPSPINGFFLSGCIFFFIAAAIGVFAKQK